MHLQQYQRLSGAERSPVSTFIAYDLASDVSTAVCGYGISVRVVYINAAQNEKPICLAKSSKKNGSTYGRVRSGPMAANVG